MQTHHYTRREALRVLGASAVAATLPAWALADTPTGERPNILFIMSDDHAAHAISCYGSRINKTPNLDRLAREGVRFTNCFCTNSICAPSRASILTGKYSHVNGMYDNRQQFDTTQPTFPKLMQAAGYQTAMIGKWHLRCDPQGFDYWSILPGQGIYHDPEFITMGQRATHTGYVTDIITDQSINWLKQRQPDQPFLLLCQHKAPHRSWQPDDKHANMYADADVPEPPTFDDDYATRCDAARQQAMTIEHHLTENDTKGPPPEGLTGEALKKWKYQRYIKDYLRCVASLDDNIGRLMEYLEQSGLEKNTIVVYTSDQGFFLGDHGWYDKRFMYEESLRMPLLVRYPGTVRPGGTSDDIVLNIDFASTFLDCAGLKPPAEFQGQSLRPILGGKAPADWRQAMYYSYYEYGDEGKGGWHCVRPHYGVRTQRHKLIHFHHGVEAWELYDLEKDPHELHNVYDDPEYASVVAELKKELTRLRATYGETDEVTQRIMDARAAANDG